ncbi:hypothetical protein L1049_004294 [Liquidambar formosana]|uniref:Late embryogenesis abundant protein LEA-2 subgroup domain-containing protein n=1 Tax=Liquidambar formosana TaxID=63359 RepID=A0AAP0WVJ2_LIQFO
MASSPKTQPTPYYHPIPPPPDHHHPQNYVVLPLYYPAGHRRRLPCRLICTISFLLLALAVYVFWPSDPDVKIVRLRLDRVRIHTIPRISLDISLALTVRVHNVDMYYMDYKHLHVAVGYRGRELGHVRSSHGHVRARGSSDVDAMLEFNGVEVLYDVVYLLEDLAKGTVPFDTVTKVRGHLGLFFIQLPLEVVLYIYPYTSALCRLKYIDYCSFCPSLLLGGL